jgi:Leu/Phe-tRNA-protein transferase
MIRPIAPEFLREELLRDRIYPDTTHTHYWSQSWDPGFYVDLARAGFISISFVHPSLGPVLIPELQKDYAVLDWEDLHRSRNLRKLLRPDRLARDELELRITDPCERVVERLLAYHGESCWIQEPYREMLHGLPRAPDVRFALHGIELWSRRRDELVAGELGYSIGSIYTSLSGFCLQSETRWRHHGTLQMHLLAAELQARGYAFWNMGHPGLPYKSALGARIIPRREFLARFLQARDVPPTALLECAAIPI